jgi:hypothetical protein
MGSKKVELDLCTKAKVAEASEMAKFTVTQIITKFNTGMAQWHIIGTYLKLRCLKTMKQYNKKL